MTRLPNQKDTQCLVHHQSIDVNSKAYPMVWDRSFLLNKKRKEDFKILQIELIEVFVSIICLIVFICLKG